MSTFEFGNRIKGRLNGGLESVVNRLGGNSPGNTSPWGVEEFGNLLKEQGIEVPDKVDDQGQPVISDGERIKMTPAEIPETDDLYKYAQKALAADPRFAAAQAVGKFASGVASDMASAAGQAANRGYQSMAMSGNRQYIGSAARGPFTPHVAENPFSDSVKIKWDGPQDPNAPSGDVKSDGKPPKYTGPMPDSPLWDPSVSGPPADTFGSGVSTGPAGRSADPFADQRVNPFKPRPASSTMASSADGAPTPVNPFAPRIRSTRSSVEPGSFGAPTPASPTARRPRSGGNPSAISGLLGRGGGDSNWASTVLPQGEVFDPDSTDFSNEDWLLNEPEWIRNNKFTR